MRISKLFKWSASAVRVAAHKVVLRKRLVLPKSGKPIYIGRGARIHVAEGASVVLGPGVYLSENAVLQANKGAELELGKGVFLNANARIVAAESVRVQEYTLLGPNTCVFDHDHVFDYEGVHADLLTTPVRIGSRCWLGANTIVTKGVTLADRILLGGGQLPRALCWNRAFMSVPRPILSGASALGAGA